MDSQHQEIFLSSPASGFTPLWVCIGQCHPPIHPFLPLFTPPSMPASIHPSIMFVSADLPHIRHTFLSTHDPWTQLQWHARMYIVFVKLLLLPYFPSSPFPPPLYPLCCSVLPLETSVWLDSEREIEYRGQRGPREQPSRYVCVYQCVRMCLWCLETDRWMSHELKTLLYVFPGISYLVTTFIIMSSGCGCSCILLIFLFSVTLLHLSLIDCLINHPIRDMGTHFLLMWIYAMFLHLCSFTVLVVQYSCAWVKPTLSSISTVESIKFWLLNDLEPQCLRPLPPLAYISRLIERDSWTWCSTQMMIFRFSLTGI